MSFYKYYHPDSFDFICVDGGVSIRFSQPELLNDPFDSNLTNSGLNEKEVKKFKDSLIKMGMKPNEESFEKLKYEDPKITQEKVNNYIKSTYGILSLSKNGKSRTMWAYYSKDHAGFMINFKSIQNDELNIKFEEVKYSCERPDYKNIESENIEQSLFIKDKEWIHEDECRAIAELQHISSIKTDAKGYPIHSIILPSINIDSIVLGVRSDDILARKVKFWVKTHAPHVMIEKAVPCENDYKLKYESTLLR